MRLPLLLLFLYISYVTSDDKYAVKSFPKKVKTFGSGKILINSGKYVSKNKTLDLLTLSDLQKPLPNNKDKSKKYTAFQEIGNTKAKRGVPDSPYFSLDQTIEPKSRVKKVLPDYVWSSLKLQKKPRVKRAAVSTHVGTHVGTHGATHVASNSKAAPASSSKATAKEVKPKITAKSAIHTAESKKTNPTTALRTVEGAEKKAISKVTSKQEVKASPAKGVKRVTKNSKTRKHPSVLRSGSKTKSKGKSRVKAGAKKNKNEKRRGKSKSRTRVKKSSRSHPLRKPRAKSGGKKIKSVSKKHTRRSENDTVKILPDTRRLTGATQASIENYPYVVSILKDGEHWCSGALLNQRVVITTANCLWKSNRISRMEVRAGSSYTTHGGQLANIQEVMKHPRWGLRKNPDNDVALILLDRNIKFSDSCHGVDLPNRLMVPAFDDAWVVSFGAERRDGMYDIHQDGLQVYHTFVMSNESCNNVTMRFGVTVTENFICFTQSGKTSPCTRDTGAPAVSDGVVWGLASWGIRKLCGTERFPSMFSNLASHSNMDFIADATRRLMSEKRIYQFLDRTFAPRAKYIPGGSTTERIG